MHKIVEEQNEAVDKVLGKHHKFMEFANNSSPFQNAVALSSILPEKPVEPLLQDSLPPAPAFRNMRRSIATGQGRPRRPKRTPSTSPLLRWRQLRMFRYSMR
jgi:hypothetical protein